MVGNNDVEWFRGGADFHERHPAIGRVGYFRGRTAQQKRKQLRYGRLILDSQNA
jgi:hypothetical protein